MHSGPLPSHHSPVLERLKLLAGGVLFPGMHTAAAQGRPASESLASRHLNRRPGALVLGRAGHFLLGCQGHLVQGCKGKGRKTRAASGRLIPHTDIRPPTGPRACKLSRLMCVCVRVRACARACLCVCARAHCPNLGNAACSWVVWLCQLPGEILAAGQRLVGPLHLCLLVRDQKGARKGRGSGRIPA